MSCPVMHRRTNQARSYSEEDFDDGANIKDIGVPRTAQQKPFDSNTGTVTNSHDNINPHINAMKIETEYADEKEQKLAEFVSKMDQNRHTSGVEGFKNSQRQKAEVLFQDMLVYTRQIELNILVGENEVFQRNEDAFFSNLDEIEVAELKKRHELEVKNLKSRQEQSLKDFNNRKIAKKFQRSQQRELKDLYINTQFRADLFKKTEEIKVTLRHMREKNAKIVGHIEERHIKQVKQFNQAEERGFADQKVLIELECQNLSEEQRSETMKKFQSKVNHQKVINKKKLDHIREQQRLELRQYKEKVDHETKMIEELANLKETQSQAEQDVIADQRQEIIGEKEKVQATQKQLKIIDMQAEHALEITKMQASQRIQLRQIGRTQKERKIKRYKHWSGIINRDITLEHASLNASVLGSHSGSPQAKSIAHSIAHSQAHSRRNSNPDLKESKQLINTQQENAEDNVDSKLASSHREMKADETKEHLLRMQQGLLDLKKKHEKALYALKQNHETAYADLKEKFQEELTEMEWRHEVEKKRLTTDNDADIEEALANQEKELIMEGHIRKAETKALIERKVLNNLLDTFVDGVISIDPRGFIKRFNRAAEKMFGYTTAEILEKNMNIKCLMPKKYSVDHDTYLLNYFQTGVKKVIGTGRQVAGLKSDGSEFPIHLSISEVVEDGFHLFTAIVRDLSENVEEENYLQSTETQMMWKVEKSGKVLSLNQKFKQYFGVNAKEQEDTLDIFSKDVVHPSEYQASRDAFANGNRTMQQFEVKRRLKSVNGTYRWFLTKGIPVYDTKGKFRFWCGNCSDIDDTVVLKEEMNTLQEKLPVFLWKSSPAGELYYGNSNFIHFTGFDFAKQPTSFFGAEFCYAEDIEKVQKTIEIASSKKIAFDLKIRLKAKNGSYKWFHIAGSPILDGSGDLVNFYGICTNIDDSEKMSKEMEILPENLPQMIWKADTNGNVLYSNSKFQKYVGAPPGAKLNVFDPAVVHPDDHKNSLVAFTTGNAQKKPFLSKRRLLCHDGKYNSFVTKGIPIIDEASGNVLSWYGTCTADEYAAADSATNAYTSSEDSVYAGFPIIESQWRNSEICRGPPSTIFMFSSYYAAKRAIPDQWRTSGGPLNATWPIMYQIFQPIYPYKASCGQALVDIPGDCCISSLYPLEATRNYKSGLTHYTRPPSTSFNTDWSKPVDDPLSYLPDSASTHTYCLLLGLKKESLQTAGLGASRYGYGGIMVLADGVCYEGTYKCHAANQSLELFGPRLVTTINSTTTNSTSAFLYPNQDECRGDIIESYFLDTQTDVSNMTTFTSSRLGVFNASMYTVPAQVLGRVGWVSYVPAAKMIPDFKRPVEVFGAFVYVVGLCFFGWALYYAGHEYFKKKRKSQINLLVAQILWTLYILFRVSYSYTDFETNYLALGIVKYMVDVLWATATASTALYTATYLLRIFPLNQMKRVVAWTLFFTVHLALAGDCYCGALLTTPFQSAQDSNLVSILNFWKTLRDYWIVALFIFDLMPAIWFVHIMFPPKLSIKERILFLYFQHGVFLVLLLLQFSLIGIYYSVSFLQSRTAILGDDRTFSAMTSLLSVFLAMHCLMNCFLIESTKVILKNVKQVSFESELSKDPDVEYVKDPQPMIRLADLQNIRSSQFRSSAYPQTGSRGKTFQLSEEAGQLGTVQLSYNSNAAYYQPSAKIGHPNQSEQEQEDGNPAALPWLGRRDPSFRVGGGAGMAPTQRRVTVASIQLPGFGIRDMSPSAAVAVPNAVPGTAAAANQKGQIINSSLDLLDEN